MSDDTRDGADEVATVNERHWDWAVRKGAGCTKPWLDLDADALRAMVTGDAAPSDRLDKIQIVTLALKEPELPRRRDHRCQCHGHIGTHQRSGAPFLMM